MSRIKLTEYGTGNNIEIDTDNIKRFHSCEPDGVTFIYQIIGYFIAVQETMEEVNTLIYDACNDSDIVKALQDENAVLNDNIARQDKTLSVLREKTITLSNEKRLLQESVKVKDRRIASNRERIDMLSDKIVALEIQCRSQCAKIVDLQEENTTLKVELSTAGHAISGLVGAMEDMAKRNENQKEEEKEAEQDFPLWLQELVGDRCVLFIFL